jgi:ComF family protein
VNRRGNVLNDLFRRYIAGSCVFCGERSASGQICAQCRELLPWNDEFCDLCGQVMYSGQLANACCEACQARSPPFEKARAPLVYDFPVDAVVKAIKFKRQLCYVPALAALLLETLKRDFPEVDALVPVPLHCMRQMRRGFNQALELCRPLRRKTALPILMQAKRTRATAAQTGLNAAERRKNMKNAFVVRGKLECRHPLIIDDVITTGETCSHLAVELLKAGAESVGVLAVARAHTGNTGLKV